VEHVVTVEPAGVRFLAAHGETVFAAARRHGISWPTRCLGRASCRQCFFEADEVAAEALGAAGRLEKEALKRLIVEPTPGVQTRLACQATVLADVKIFRAGVHPLEMPPLDDPQP